MYNHLKLRIIEFTTRISFYIYRESRSSSTKSTVLPCSPERTNQTVAWWKANRRGVQLVEMSFIAAGGTVDSCPSPRRSFFHLCLFLNFVLFVGWFIGRVSQKPPSWPWNLDGGRVQTLFRMGPGAYLQLFFFFLISRGISDGPCQKKIQQTKTTKSVFR